jgi:iron complex transport system ATP-binding protein
MNQVILAENLDVGYEKKTVVEHVNINGLRGQLICLLGPNGAGKTTILRTLSGLLAPMGGTVCINGDNICHSSKDALAKKLAVVLTEQMSLGFMTVFEIAAMGRYPHTNHFGKLSAVDIGVVEEALTAVDALKLKDRYFSELSDGEKQKVMIARALVQEPQLIVLDEPTSHLDVKHKVEVLTILQRLCDEKGITVILSLHDIDLAIKACQTVLLIRHGKIVAQGMPEEVITDGTIQKLYDIKGADYNELMGSLEFHNERKPEVFVTGGNGTGAGIYRALSRAGFGIVCGVLHSNDVDAYIGKSLNCMVIEENPFSEISEGHFMEATAVLGMVGYMIDTGFPIGKGNRRNLEIIINAAKNGKRVYSLCGDQEKTQRYGEAARNISYCGSICELVKKITEEKAGKHEHAY